MAAPSSPGRLRHFWHSIVPAPLRHGVIVFLVLLIVQYFVIPDITNARRNLHILSRVNFVWLAIAVICEAASLYSYALLTRTLLPKGSLGISRIFRIDLSTTAVAHVIPAGSAGSASLGYRLFTQNGINGGDAAFAMATQGIGSAVVLNVMLWLSLVISIPIAGFQARSRGIYETVALVGMLALLGAGALVYLFTHEEDVAVKILRAIGRRIPRVGADRFERAARRISASIEALARDRELLRRAATWAALNWLLDAASLWSFVVAFGRFFNPIELFAAYGIANVLAVIPITPGGLGIIDSLAPALLIGFGLSSGVAYLGVVAWRLVNFWLPIPVGGASYLSLRGPQRAATQSRREALREMTIRDPEGPPDLASTDPPLP